MNLRSFNDENGQLRLFGQEEVLDKIGCAYHKMDDIRERLHETVPLAQSIVLDIFKTVEL